MDQARKISEEEVVPTTVYLGSYLSRLQPTTNMGASAEGAEMITFLAPPFKWPSALSSIAKSATRHGRTSAALRLLVDCGEDTLIRSLSRLFSMECEGGGDVQWTRRCTQHRRRPS
jgi:hypothetical protein